MPADSDHRFGHGKAEALAALAQVALITVSAIGIAWRAVDRLINGARDRGDGARHRRLAPRDRRDLRAALVSAAA